MLVHSPSIPKRIEFVRLKERQPAITIEDLAQMLEIDLTLMGDRNGFRKRLRRALNDAFQQGMK